MSMPTKTIDGQLYRCVSQNAHKKSSAEWVADNIRKSGYHARIFKVKNREGKTRYEVYKGARIKS